jgi:hypothetical protein
MILLIIDVDAITPMPASPPITLPPFAAVVLPRCRRARDMPHALLMPRCYAPMISAREAKEARR